jgi:MOSC domain-containing protein YiiM
VNSQPVQLRVLGVQVGAVQPLQAGEQRVMSGIRKQAARGPVAVGALGLAGDEQADLTVHGGLAKAVYAYPLEHYAFWREHRRALGLSTDLPCGSLGENLTLSGVLETSLYLGDQLRFPDCVLRVTQPRRPCYKLNAAMNDPTAVRTLAQSGFSGFYLAVDVPGSLSAGQAFEVIAGPRETPLMALFQSTRAKDR